METTGSRIVQFYENKNILLTGATGFLGKLILEQILRKCNPEKVYILVRNKKGKNPTERLKEIFQAPIFETLKAIKPDFTSKIEMVFGDISLPDLGLDDASRKLLIEKVHIVLHGAATVNFDEHIRLATFINVRGTKLICQLCQEMKNLQSFVHVSTAFCNCPRSEIDEVIYEPPLKGDDLIKIIESLDDNKLSEITPALLGQWPNSYAYTKMIGEGCLQQYSVGLPVSVFRPAIVVSTKEDPVPGWTDNLYSVIGLTAGVGAGLIRVANVNPSVLAELVPADLTVHGILACAYKTSLIGSSPEVPVYNYVSSPQNPLNWRDFMAYSFEYATHSAQCVWYVTLSLISSPLLFTILSFLNHTLPALLVDLVFMALGKQPKAIKTYAKIGKFLSVISYFAGRSWVFHDNNVRALWAGLDKKDKELFNFNIVDLDWKDYVWRYNGGIRLYIFKEQPDTLPYALRRMVWLHILHRLVQAVFFGSVFYMSWIICSRTVQFIAS